MSSSTVTDAAPSREKTSSGEAAVSLNKVSHTFPPARRGGEPRAALSEVSFEVRRGEIFGLLGPNGGGKTTLFRLLSTALDLKSGSASVFGVSVGARPADVRRKIGVVFQSPSLDKQLTVRENLVHQGHLYGLTGAVLENRIKELSAAFTLEDRMKDRVSVLSGGLQRRVEIAKGLLHTPDLLLLDEPTTGLDPGARIDVWKYLARLKSSGMTVVVTTHLMEEAEKCDRLAILNRGRVVSLGSPAELKSCIGGDVISVQSERAAELAEKASSRFHVEARVVDGRVLIEKEAGHAFIPQLVEAFPGLVVSVTLGKPTLEDVFSHLTGRRFSEEEENV